MTPTPTPPNGRRSFASSLAWSASTRSVLTTAAWWALVEGDTSVLGYGFAVVPLVVALGLVLSPPPAVRRPRPWARLVAGGGLTLWLLGRALAGGTDVARRAAAPRVDVDPFWTTYRTGLADEPARVVLVLLMNLLPGSLSASLHGDVVDVHVISPDLDVTGTLVELERRLTVVLGR